MLKLSHSCGKTNNQSVVVHVTNKPKSCVLILFVRLETIKQFKIYYL